MTAVLLESSKPGASAWVALRRCRSVRVSGIADGDVLVIIVAPTGEELSVDEDGIFILPAGADMMKVKHVRAAGERENGGVSVDLVKADGTASAI